MISIPLPASERAKTVLVEKKTATTLCTRQKGKNDLFAQHQARPIVLVKDPSAALIGTPLACYLQRTQRCPPGRRRLRRLLPRRFDAELHPRGSPGIQRFGSPSQSPDREGQSPSLPAEVGCVTRPLGSTFIRVYVPEREKPYQPPEVRRNSSGAKDLSFENWECIRKRQGCGSRACLPCRVRRSGRRASLTFSDHETGTIHSEAISIQQAPGTRGRTTLGLALVATADAGRGNLRKFRRQLRRRFAGYGPWRHLSRHFSRFGWRPSWWRPRRCSRGRLWARLGFARKTSRGPIG